MRDPEKRLGSKKNGGFGAFKAHPFFSDIDWQVAEKKELEVPFIPFVNQCLC
jgi:hypothetical protein